MKYKEYPETQRFLWKNPQISFFHSHQLEKNMKDLIVALLNYFVCDHFILHQLPLAGWGLWVLLNVYSREWSDVTNSIPTPVARSQQYYLCFAY